MNESHYDAHISIDLELFGEWDDLVYIAKSCSSVHCLMPPRSFGPKAEMSLTLAQGYYSQGEALQEDTKTQLKFHLPILSEVPKVRKRLEIVIVTHTARTDFLIDSDLLELLNEKRIPVTVVVYDR